MRFRGLAVLALAAALAPAPAGAQFWGPARPQGPWCAVYPGAFNDTRWDCFYPTLESCVPNILAGTRGFCNPNPRYDGPPPRRHRRKH
ncbi:MAG TPA: DUF3551 domain-containing protein [Pseudolabrys sp.]|nr:DUF3551 domain-containing protein [Pseudolabrys sp.]